MTDSLALPNIWQQLWWRLKPASPAAYVCANFDSRQPGLDQAVRAFVADSYPQNHTFTAGADRLTPSRKLAKRLDRLTRHYPVGWSSFADLSCSKGYFVFHAAQHPNCRRALGVDLDQRCVSSCQKLQAICPHRERINFSEITLPRLADRIEEFGGPFDVALLINTYQYLVFGSDVAPAVSPDHSEIFRLLRRVCSGRLIFHNRLSFSDLQHDPQNRALRLSHCVYEPDVIRAAANEFFHVKALDRWSKRPVWLLEAK